MRACILLTAKRRLILLFGLGLSIGLWAQSKLDAPIHYSSQDSMVLTATGDAYLHGKGEIKYEEMTLEAEYIHCVMDSSLIRATGVWDSVNEEWKGKPVFKDSHDKYESKAMSYNIQTKKGYIRNVVSEQGEGYIQADRTKKLADNTLLMAQGKYTTCDQHDHPHFYMHMTKAKVAPGDYIAAGPAYLVVGDVPVPVAIPFGFFPFTSKYASGLIMPTFGDNYERGLYLQGLGYYFAINDYLDLELKGDIYSRGTWAVYANSRYIKRYAFSGNISLSYRCDVISEPDLPDYAKNTNFNIQWTHTQDSKANPYNSFSASVNFSSSGYNRSNINSYYNVLLNSENTKSSSISYTQRFPNSPWSISMSALVSQRTKDSTLSLTLPDLTVSMSRVYPFKRKKAVGKDKWYEKIAISYTGNAKIAIDNVKEDQFLHTNFLRDWKTGLKHNVPISASFMAFKYLSITPSITMTDRMYFQRIDKSWNNQTQALQRDTSYGFYNVFDFSASISLSTKLYGYFIPIRKLFPNGKVDRFRHVLTPALSFSYRPDFGKSFWGYYGTYDEPVYTDKIDPLTGLKIQQYDANGNPMYVQQTYSRYENGIYGTAAQGAQGMLNFSLASNLEVKVRNDKDTTGKAPYKVWSIIDNLSIGGGYNFIADSMNWSNFSVNLRLKLPIKNYTINMNTSLDPYMYELNALGTPIRTNKQYWHNGRFPHWNGCSFSFSYTFTNDTFKKWFKKGKHNDNQNNEIQPTTTNDDGTENNGKQRYREATIDDGYMKTEFPWSLTINYSIAYRNLSTFNYEKMQYDMGLTNNLSFSGTLGLGQGWKISATAYYDFNAHTLANATFNITRDLHCWSMSCSFVPVGPYKSYTFHIGVNASILKDLKYDKSSTDDTNKQINWW